MDTLKNLRLSKNNYNFPDSTMGLILHGCNEQQISHYLIDTTIIPEDDQAAENKVAEE
jgi:hypothetical protein